MSSEVLLTGIHKLSAAWPYSAKMLPDMLLNMISLIVVMFSATFSQLLNEAEFDSCVNRASEGGDGHWVEADSTHDQGVRRC